MVVTYTGTAKKAIPKKPTLSTGTSGASNITPTPTVTTPVNNQSVMSGSTKKPRPIIRNAGPTPYIAKGETKTPATQGPVDTFGAVSGQSTLGQTVTPGARLSTGETLTKETVKPTELGNLNVWGEAAKGAEQASPGTLVKRNDAVIQNLLSQGVTDQAGIKSYLEGQEGFTNATPEEQANTLRALTEQMGITPGATATPETTTEQPAQDVVGLSRAKDQAEFATKMKEEMDYRKKMRDKELEIKNLEGETIKVQSSQRIQQAQNQLDSMKQRYAYLGTQGQPGVSAAGLDGISKQLSQAEQTFAQMKQMEQNAAQMRELGIQYDSMAFEKEMEDMQYKLDQQVTQAVQQKVNEFNSMAGGVDTLEELEQVKGTMMQELDKSIANIAISNQADRQLILDRYNEVIKTNEEFVKNKNTVNKEMSSVLGYYVDGNGSPIMNSQGLPVQIPPEAPMDPIFDKETGTFITFSTGANGEIVANPQQIIQGKQNPRQKGEDGTFYRTGANGELEFANAPGTGVSGTSASYTGPTIPAVDQNIVQQKLQPILSAKDGSKVGDGWCGTFVNNYTESLGLGRMFIDPIDIRKTQTNSNMPTIGSVAVFDYGNNPNVSQAAQKYGHVAIVQSINNDGTITIKEQNGNNKMAVGTRTVPASKVYGYFDPTKGLTSGSQKFTSSQIEQFKNYNGNSIPEQYKTQAQKQEFLNNLDLYRQQNPNFLTKGDKNDLKEIQSNLSQDPAYKNYRAIASNVNSFNDILGRLSNGTATAQDKQALISNFSKVLDPNSVVRDSEYATTAGFSQSKLENLQKEISNYFTVGGPLSNEGAKVLADGLGFQYKALAETYNQTLDTALQSASYTLGRDITDPIVLQAQYAVIPKSSKERDSEKRAKDTNDLLLNMIKTANKTSSNTPKGRTGGKSRKLFI